MITIVDSGVANVGSIANMLRRIGVDAEVTRDPERVRRANKLILPGVGSFDAGMAGLRENGLVEALHEAVLSRGVPVLGLCLGMQLFAFDSEEGKTRGLGWLDARCVRFAFGSKSPELKVPHMGWNQVSVRTDHAVFTDLYDGARFYFVHSYHVVAANAGNVLAQTQYGGWFVSAIVSDNIIGVQFHPEKSHRYGMKFFANFAERV